MILTRKVLVEKEITLFDAIVHSQEKGELTNDAVELLKDLCYNYTIKTLKFASRKEREHLYYGSLNFCFNNYDKFNANHPCRIKSNKKRYCEMYFRTIIRYYLFK